MLSSQFIPLNEDGRVFVSSRHIKRKQLAGVWLKQLVDDVWVNANSDDYQLVNNAIVFDDDLLSSVYSQVELRVGDNESDLGISPSDISKVASIDADIQTVSDNIDGVVTVSDNIGSILTATSAAATASNAALAAEQYKDLASTSASNASASETNAQGFAISASTSASNASTSESNALSSESNASISEVNALVSAWEAEAERLTANSYATEEEDVFVKSYTSNGDGTLTATNTPYYSSLHWQRKAEIEKNLVGNASTIDIEDIASNYTSDNVEDALAEVATNKAKLDSPSFTGTPTAPTPAIDDNSTKIATTAFVKSNTLDANSVGKVLQVVQVNKTDVFSTTSTVFVDIAGLSASITPSSIASKILVTININLSTVVGQSATVRLMRDGIVIGGGDVVGSRSSGIGGGNFTSFYLMLPISATELDEPATISEVTYKLQVITNNTAYINRSGSADVDANYIPRTASTITLTEIGA